MVAWSSAEFCRVVLNFDPFSFREFLVEVGRDEPHGDSVVVCKEQVEIG